LDLALRVSRRRRGATARRLPVAVALSVSGRRPRGPLPAVTSAAASDARRASSKRPSSRTTASHFPRQASRPTALMGRSDGHGRHRAGRRAEHPGRFPRPAPSVGASGAGRSSGPIVGATAIGTAWSTWPTPKANGRSRAGITRPIAMRSLRGSLRGSARWRDAGAA